MTARAAVAVPGAPDAPTEGDRRRFRNARRKARARLHEIEAARDAAVVEAFRIELGAVVRSASPLLAPMLAADGLTLDDVAVRIEPELGWPRRPRLGGSKGAPTPTMTAHTLRHYIAGLNASLTSQPSSGCEVRRRDGDYLAIRVVDHSVELFALIGGVRIDTRFGELRVRTADAVPDTILGASVGRLIEEIIDHPAWRGRGWRIAAVDEDGGRIGPALVVMTGSVGYRMSWAR